jgi:hypothetical protein
MTIKVLAGYIAGGRADTIPRVEEVNFPTTPKEGLKWFDSDEASDYQPNFSGDIPKIIKVVISGKIYTGTDCFGEGVIGFIKGSKLEKTKILKLKNALRKEYLNGGDDEGDED